MINGKSILAIIPARGGSKRLPGKNIIPLAGKPMIHWTIEAAKKSKYLDAVCVSTDDSGIAKISLSAGVEVPFIRPIELSNDESSTIDVVLHAINHYKLILKREYDYIILLQPTSPIRNDKHIDESIELMIAKQADAIISVCEMDHSPLWSNELPPDLSLKNFISAELENKRSQDLPKYYRINGAIYICKISKFLEKKAFFINENIFAYIMPRENSIDIDTELDYKIAEEILKG